MSLQSLEGFIESHGGVVTSAQLKKAGFSPGLIAYAYDRGRIDRLTRGVYCTLDVFEDDFVVIAYRWRRCVFSHDSALYLNGLSDRAPSALSVTVPYGYNPKGLKSSYPSIRIHHVSPTLYELGMKSVNTPMGNLVPCYDAERCLADIIKQRRSSAVDSQLMHDSVGGYFKSSYRNLGRLAAMCAALGVREDLSRYLEVYSPGNGL